MINRGEEMENNSKKIDEVNLNQNVDLEENNTKEEIKNSEEVNENQQVNENEEVNKAEVVDETEELKIQNRRLKDENKKLDNELETLKERFLRTSAEYENFRNRTEKEKKSIYTDACEDVLKNILPIYDNLNRAIIADGKIEDLKLGVESVMKQFIQSLEKLGIEEIDTDGEFNPEYHNAIMHIEDDSFGKNEIVEVFQKGFKRGDKVLRYSLVKVAN